MLLPVCVALTGLISGCNDPSGTDIDVLHIEGVTWASNVSTSYAVFGSSSENEEDPEISLPVSEGDMLYMLHEDLQLYYRYSPKNGNNYAVSFDTVQAVSGYMNGRLSYMELTSSSSVEAFSKLTEVEMEQIESLYIADVLTEDLIPILKEHESSLQGKGLILENNYGSGSVQDLLTIIRPEFLVIDDSWILPGPEEHISMSSLELLWAEGNIPELERLARCCSNLESLIIADWEPAEGELLPLSGLNKLQNLTIAESDIITLSSVDLPQSLRNLFLISCDTLSDLAGLSELPFLSGLSLTQCSRIQKLETIIEQETLKRLSFPPDVSHEEFLSLTEQLTVLEMVELIDCYEIKDLSPLQELAELKILQLQLDYDQLSLLDSLDQLELLILSSYMFDDNPEWISELRTSLPNTKIVPGSGICLGSGWLLLLLPLIMLFRYFSGTKSR